MKIGGFTGIQPSGIIHLGNYFSAIAPVAQSNAGVNAVMVADLHATGSLRNQDALVKTIRTLDAIRSANSANFIIFRQSQHTLAMWLLASKVKVSDIIGMSQWKEKSKRLVPTAALLTYPILQAADIMLYNPERVFVGRDQEQHIELYSKINQLIRNGEQPKFVYSDVSIKSLKNPKAKMSKSTDDPDSIIGLIDDSIEAKIKRATTTDEGLSNLIKIYELASGSAVDDAQAQKFKSNCAEFKAELSSIIAGYLKPIREAYDANAGLSSKSLESDESVAKSIAHQNFEKIFANF